MIQTVLKAAEGAYLEFIWPFQTVFYASERDVYCGTVGCTCKEVRERGLESNNKDSTAVNTLNKFLCLGGINKIRVVNKDSK